MVTFQDEAVDCAQEEWALKDLTQSSRPGDVAVEDHTHLAAAGKLVVILIRCFVWSRHIFCT